MDLDGLLKDTADGVCGVGRDGRIVMWNRSAERILGHTAPEVLGRPCCDVFAGRDVGGNRLCYPACHVRALIGQGELVQHFQMATRTKQGKPLWLDVSILVVPERQRDLSTTVHLFRDATVAHEVEALVRQRLAETAPSPSNGGGNGAGNGNGLTRRELEILRLLAEGANTRVVAERLRVSRATVRNHVQNIFGKLEVHSRLEAVACATRHRLL
jgi:PAS domain S-box-containing protein